jgi:hypothetical protein
MRNPLKKEAKEVQSSTSQPRTSKEAKPSIFAPKKVLDDKQLKIVTHAPKDDQELLADGSPSKRSKKVDKHSKLEK